MDSRTGHVLLNNTVLKKNQLKTLREGGWVDQSYKGEAEHQYKNNRKSIKKSFI